jgi:hypothetical protein
VFVLIAAAAELIRFEGHLRSIAFDYWDRTLCAIQTIDNHKCFVITRYFGLTKESILHAEMKEQAA